VSIVIPARNESHNISRLLESLKHQTYPPLEVIVVDDDSLDTTAALASEMAANVISSRGLPSGWCGKPWACWQGAELARGELLLFLDADTWLEPSAVERLVLGHQQRGGMLSVQPYHVAMRAYEQLSAFFTMVLMAGVNAFTPLGDRLRPRGAFGQCIICERKAYFDVGGHSAVKGEVLEDMKLAQAFAGHGLPVTCRGGRGTISCRMYPGGIRQLIEGWSKNFGSGAFEIRWSFFLLVFLWITGAFQACLSLLWPLSEPDWATIGLPILLYLAFAFQIGWILRRIGDFPVWTAALFPIPLVLFALVMVRSLGLAHVVHRVTWKGRVISTARRGM
jgi:4,4'-diaponeurosporenoate glycosyltransferase